MEQQTRNEAEQKATRVVAGWVFGHEVQRAIAAALLFERSEVERLTAELATPPRPPIADEARERTYDYARWLMGREDADEDATRLAQGLIAERAEADRLRSVLADVERFIAKHRGQK